MTIDIDMFHNCTIGKNGTELQLDVVELRELFHRIAFGPNCVGEIIELNDPSQIQIFRIGDKVEVIANHPSGHGAAVVSVPYSKIDDFTRLFRERGLLN